MTSIAFIRSRAHAQIDAVAGDKRLQFISDVPGQQAVYLVKREQAAAYVEAYASDPLTAPPPYVAAEAAAISAPPIDVANNILATAAAWNDVVGPAIEAARLGGKAAVTAASGADDAATAEAIESARVAAIANINAI